MFGNDLNYILQVCDKTTIWDPWIGSQPNLSFGRDPIKGFH